MVMMNATRLLTAAALLIAGCSRSAPVPDEPSLPADASAKTVTIYVAGMNQQLQIL